MHEALSTPAPGVKVCVGQLLHCHVWHRVVSDQEEWIRATSVGDGAPVHGDADEEGARIVAVETKNHAVSHTDIERICPEPIFARVVRVFIIPGDSSQGNQVIDTVKPLACIAHVRSSAFTGRNVDLEPGEERDDQDRRREK